MENNDSTWMPRVDEPMDEYLRSDRYRNSFSGITVSDFKGQEETNYEFWRHLTPSQRLQLHTLMVQTLYNGRIIQDDANKQSDIVFTVEPL